MTTQMKGYPFEVIINAKGISGAVLADQVKNLDWKARKATVEELDEVRAKIASLLGM